VRRLRLAASSRKTNCAPSLLTTHKAIRDALEIATKNGWQTHVADNDHVRALLADLDAKTEALERIASITNQMFGGDWDEIEDAREIARAALKGTP